MPVYEYKCEKGHVFETIQRMADAPLTECEKCGAPVRRVLHSPAVHFKGSGFYNTDYGTKRRARELEKSASDGADKNDAKAKDAKKDAKDAGASKPAPSSSSADKK